jgi:hypothetical protein
LRQFAKRFAFDIVEDNMNLQRYVASTTPFGGTTTYATTSSGSMASSLALGSSTTVVDLGAAFNLGAGVAPIIRPLAVMNARNSLPASDGITNTATERLLVVAQGISRSGSIGPELAYVSTHSSVLDAADAQDALLAYPSASSSQLDTQTRQVVLEVDASWDVILPNMAIVVDSGGNLFYSTYATAAEAATGLQSATSATATGFALDLATAMVVKSSSYSGGTASLSTVSVDVMVAAPTAPASLPQFIIYSDGGPDPGNMTALTGYAGRAWNISSREDSLANAIAAVNALAGSGVYAAFDTDNLATVYGRSPVIAAALASPDKPTDPTWIAMTQEEYLAWERLQILTELATDIPGFFAQTSAELAAVLGTATCRTRRSGQTAASCIADLPAVNTL